MDLKDYSKTKGKYVLYLICEFTKFTKAKVMRDKSADTVIKAINDIWIIGGGAGPGFPKRFFYDNGSEFCNDTMVELAGKAGINISTTGYYSGWQNG